jgi:hypothetical protein
VWTRKSYVVHPKWMQQPAPGRVRVITGTSRVATVCSLDLVPLAEARLPFDPYSSALAAVVDDDGALTIDYFGPN